MTVTRQEGNSRLPPVSGWDRYPHYKTTDLDWFQEIPKGWRSTRLKWLTSHIGSGKTPRGGAEVYEETGILFLRSQNIQFEGLSLNEVAYIDVETDKEMASTRVYPGDVLLNITGASLGRCSFVPQGLPPANVNQHVCIVRPRTTDLNPRFLHYTLSSQPLQSQIFAVENGISREGLNFSQVGNLVLIKPDSIAEQRAIATFLDHKTAQIDALITEKRRLIELLQEKRNALISHAVTRGLDPDAPLKDSGIPAVGLIPAHWKVCRNKQIFAEINQRSETGEEELLSVSHISGVTPRSEKEVHMFMAESLEGYKLCAPGDLIVNTMWAWMGALGVSRQYGIVSPSYHVYRLKSNQYMPEYLDLLYRTTAYVCEITRHSKGVWSSRLRLYPDAFLNIHTISPSLHEQQEIVDHISRETSDIRQLLDELKASIRVLQEYRTALISAAVTGKIDVREWQETEGVDAVANEIGMLERSGL